MVYELLSRGKANCITRKQLCDMTGLKPRKLTLQIEKERREGQPICASCDYDNYGYYLAENQAELKDYCDRLKHRAIEIFKTRKHCLEAMDLLEPESTEEAELNLES